MGKPQDFMNQSINSLKLVSNKYFSIAKCEGKMVVLGRPYNYLVHTFLHRLPVSFLLRFSFLKIFNIAQSFSKSVYLFQRLALHAFGGRRTLCNKELHIQCNRRLSIQ
eukprot:UN27995